MNKGHQEQPTPHQILGLLPGASIDDIRRARRSLARKFHPDQAEDKEEATRMLAAINNAFDVLSTPEALAAAEAHAKAQHNAGAARRAAQDIFKTVFEDQPRNPFGQARRASESQARQEADAAETERQRKAWTREHDAAGQRFSKGQEDISAARQAAEAARQAAEARGEDGAAAARKAEASALLRQRQARNAAPQPMYRARHEEARREEGHRTHTESSAQQGYRHAREAYTRARASGEEYARKPDLSPELTGVEASFLRRGRPSSEIIMGDTVFSRMTRALDAEAGRLARERVMAARMGHEIDADDIPTLHRAQRIRFSGRTVHIDLGSRAHAGQNIVAIPTMTMADDGTIMVGRDAQLLAVACRSGGRQSAQADQSSGLIKNARNLKIEIGFSEQAENLRDQRARTQDSAR